MPPSEPESVKTSDARYAAVNSSDVEGHGYCASTASASAPNSPRTNASYCARSCPMKPCRNVRPSSRLAPLTTGTRANRPDSTASSGGIGSDRVPLVSCGEKPVVSSSAPAGLPRRQATTVAGSVQPAFAAHVVPAASVAASGRAEHEPLWIIAAENSPREPGEVRCPQTDQPPADSPPIVTRRGSPPNRATLRRTQRRDACWSWKPKSPDSPAAAVSC